MASGLIICEGCWVKKEEGGAEGWEWDETGGVDLG